MEAIAAVERRLGANPIEGLRLVSDFEDTNERFLYDVFQYEPLDPTCKTKITAPEDYLEQTLESHQGVATVESNASVSAKDSMRLDYSIRGQNIDTHLERTFVVDLGSDEEMGEGAKCACSICIPSRGSVPHSVSDFSAMENHLVNCKKLEKRLKPNDRWLALRSGLLRPAVVSKRPTSAEF